MKPKKKTRGKQKQMMKKSEEYDNFPITFNKRKTEIYNKASELSTLCGAMVDILMISPEGNPISYGEPSSKSLARTSLKEETPSLEDLTKRQMIEELNIKNEELMDKIDIAKAQRKTLTSSNCSGWWDIKEKGMSDHEKLEHIKNLTHQMINEVRNQGGEIDSHAEGWKHYDPKGKGKSDGAES